MQRLCARLVEGPLAAFHLFMGSVHFIAYERFIAHERRLSLSHFLDNALHFLDNASHFLENHQSLLCRLCFGIASER
jgi:hypothetical protein